MTMDGFNFKMNFNKCHYMRKCASSRINDWRQFNSIEVLQNIMGYDSLKKFTAKKELANKKWVFAIADAQEFSHEHGIPVRGDSKLHWSKILTTLLRALMPLNEAITFCWQSLHLHSYFVGSIKKSSNGIVSRTFVRDEKLVETAINRKVILTNNSSSSSYWWLLDLPNRKICITFRLKFIWCIICFYYFHVKMMDINGRSWWSYLPLLSTWVNLIQLGNQFALWYTLISKNGSLFWNKKNWIATASPAVYVMAQLFWLSIMNMSVFRENLIHFCRDYGIQNEATGIYKAQTM